jgi:hypothetical protein
MNVSSPLMHQEIMVIPYGPQNTCGNMGLRTAGNTAHTFAFTLYLNKKKHSPFQIEDILNFAHRAGNADSHVRRGQSCRQ